MNVESTLINIIKNQSSLDLVLRNLGLIAPELAKDEESKTVATKEQTSVSSVTGIPYRLAKCCSPLPPEDIVGVVESGHGIVVHAADCKNVSDASKTISLSWISCMEPRIRMAILWTSKSLLGSFRAFG